MAHMIENNRMFSVKQEPWHKLGVVLDTPPTSAEAIAAAGLDWRVDKRQLYFQEVSDTGGVRFVAADRQFGLVRGTDNRLLGTVTSDYEVVQNSQAFEFFDPLIREGLATYETAGCMTNGKIWVLAHVKGDMMVGGDEVRRYLLLCNGHDGASSVLVQPTPVRVVCNNTLQLSLRHGMVIGHAHRKGVMTRLEETRNRLLATVAKFDELGSVFSAAAELKMNDDAIDKYISDVLELDLTGVLSSGDDDFEICRADQNKLKARDRILELHDRGLGATSTTRGTAWGVYNAVVEFADYYAGRRARDRASYQLFGGGAEIKTRALSAMEALVTA